jgi:hypothetical protein
MFNSPDKKSNKQGNIKPASISEAGSLLSWSAQQLCQHLAGGIIN